MATASVLRLCLGGLALLGATAARADRPLQALVFDCAAAARPAGPGAAAGDPLFLLQLQVMRGHLLVAQLLYDEGKLHDAAPHFAHPLVETYAELAPALRQRGLPDFEDELTAMAGAAGTGASPREIGAALDAVLAQIEAAADSVPEAVRTDPGTQLGLAVGLLRAAAAEYEVAVDGGAVVNMTEYQDAYGFKHLAGRLLRNIGRNLEAEAADAHRSILDGLGPLSAALPSPVPPDLALADPAEVAAAVSRIADEAAAFCR
jgi:hypothetical protein